MILYVIIGLLLLLLGIGIYYFTSKKPAEEKVVYITQPPVSPPPPEIIYITQPPVTTPPPLTTAPAKTCNIGFRWNGSICQYTGCPDGSIRVDGTLSDKTDSKCNVCSGSTPLANINKDKCLAWNPSNDLPSECNINNYYANPISGNSYQCTQRTNRTNEINNSLGCKVQDALNKTNNTTVSNVVDNTPCTDNNPCTESTSKCQSGNCNIVRKPNSYASRGQCITCDSKSVVKTTNDGCFNCETDFDPFDIVSPYYKVCAPIYKVYLASQSI